ncbi:Type III secretion inner membrane protein [Photobacterium marinum]|uniref:Type III secretion inner membrane protein n=1 Tax=Photobacterium marinum TaxID=1056511 RepID=L8JIF0_9GAMM|nr:type III secretion system inner membrane ring subunit SctD [Photobacterium marinum]ELR67239.1 Type III secretion inner membrane protein [Photobacterium marinum]
MTIWKLKILSGSHSGAEMTTEQTGILLGADRSQADCVLSDCGFAPVVCQLTLTDENQVMRLLVDQPWYLDGKRQKASLARIKPYQVIQVCGVAFAIGPAEELWPVLSVPTIRQRRVPWLGLALSGVLVMGSLSASLVMSSKYSRTKRPTAEQLLVGLEYDTVELKPLNDRWVLSGYVKDKPSLQELQESLTESGQPIEWRVYRTDSVLGAVMTWLDEHGLARLDVEVDTHGVGHIRGVLKDSFDNKLLSESLLADVPGLRRIEWQTVRISELISWLQQGLSKHRLNRLMVAETDGHIYLTGKLDDEGKTRLSVMLKQASDLFGKQLPVTYQAFLLPDSKLPSIRAVSLSRTPYVVMSDGQKYLTNAVIGDGYVIREITAEGIAIARQGKQWWLPTGG